MAASSRRLAAVLAGDFAPAEDSLPEAVSAAVAAYRGEIAPLVRHHRGVLVESGDNGYLARFPTPTDAVACAAELEQAASLPTVRSGPGDDAVLTPRIGIDLGEIQESDGTLFGPAVNVAQRLRVVSESGGVFVSEEIFRAVEGRTRFTFKDLGSFAVQRMPDPVRAYSVVDLSARRAGPFGPRRVSAAVFAVAAVAIAWLLFRPEGGGLPNSIAVLPFDDLSPRGDQVYLAHGISDELIIELANIDELDVKGRMTGAAIKSAGLNASEIANQAGVNGIIDGSVRKDGERLRIGVQVISVPDGTSVWSQSFDRPLSDIFALQNEIASAVAAALRSSTPRPERAPTTSVEAYDLYIRAERRMSNFGRDDLKEALAGFSAAIASDADFALAQATMATAHRLRCELGYEPCETELPLAEAAIARALELDPQLARGWIGHATLLGKKYAWVEAEAAARKGVEFDPSDARAHAGLGQLLIATGKFEDGMAAHERALALDPLNTAILTVVANSHSAVLGNHDRALELYARAQVVDPQPPPVRALSHLMTFARAGKIEEALEVLPRLKLTEAAQAKVAEAAQRGGRSALAGTLRAMLAEASGEPCWTSPTMGAALASQSGDTEGALDCLEKALESRSFIAASSLFAETWDPLRDDPRFDSILRRMNLGA